MRRLLSILVLIGFLFSLSADAFAGDKTKKRLKKMTKPPLCQCHKK
jgi:hypothetical protein